MSTVLIECEGYLIQKRAFKNTGLIVTLLTENGELLSGIVHQGQKKNLALFQPYFINAYLREGLSLIHQLEAVKAGTSLNGEALFCGLYVNELIGRLGKGLKDAPDVYNAYQQVIDTLGSDGDKPREHPLRTFEFCLLEQLGFYMDFGVDVDGHSIVASERYLFSPDSGLKRVLDDNAYGAVSLLKGSDLLALIIKPLIDLSALKLAKWLNRQRINFLLEGKPLVSRQLFNRKTFS
mgnify:CR=1 FL=1